MIEHLAFWYAMSCIAIALAIPIYGVVTDRDLK